MINPQINGYRNTELEPGLLSTLYKIQTSWRVITGAPCSGKSTMIDLLTGQGYQTVPESARLYIEKAMSGEQENHPIRVDPAALQRGIKDMQLKVEEQLPIEENLFLDGAVPGSLAWYRVYGLNPNEILQDCFLRRYGSVFILEPLPFKTDDQRVEEMVTITRFLDEWHTRDYISLGYEVVRVPILPPAERLAFVLERLSHP